MEATFAIVIAALLGYWADEHFGTTPRWLIVGVVIGFASFVLRLMRMAKLVQDPHPKPGPEEGPPAREDD
jgi:F0F1-type ATP synthase assembly protein I